MERPQNICWRSCSNGLPPSPPALDHYAEESFSCGGHSSSQAAELTLRGRQPAGSARGRTCAKAWPVRFLVHREQLSGVEFSSPWQLVSSLSRCGRSLRHVQSGSAFPGQCSLSSASVWRSIQFKCVARANARRFGGSCPLHRRLPSRGQAFERCHGNIDGRQHRIYVCGAMQRLLFFRTRRTLRLKPMFEGKRDEICCAHHGARRCNGHKTSYGSVKTSPTGIQGCPL